MIWKLRITAFAVLLSVSSISATSGDNYAGSDDPLSIIEREYQSGNLNYSQKALLQISAIRRPHELPTKYQAPSSTSVSHARCATDAIVDIRQNWDQIDLPTQQSISQLLTRWSTAFTYDSPGGFFKLHYDVTGTNAVPSTDGNGNTIPDYIEKCAAYMDSSLARHQALGYLNPPSDGAWGGDSKFDVYFEDMGYYGYAVPEGAGPNPWNDYYSHLVLHRNFFGFPSNDDPEGNQAGAAKATAAHEFHHCIQFAYDAGEGSWFMELDATYMEDIVFDQVNDNYNYLSSFQNDPQVSLMDESIHMYASFIWGIYLVERFDTTLMRAAWNGARYKSIFDAMSDSLLAFTGYSQDSAFAEFAVWNYFTGSRDLGGTFHEASAYPSVAVDRVHASYPVLSQTGPVNPQGYGSCYIEFYPDGSSGKLRIIFNGGDAVEWGVTLLKFTDPNTHTVEKMETGNVSRLDTLDIQDFSTYEKVVMVAANVSQFFGANSFTYSATMGQPWDMSSVIDGGDPVYSGNQRTCSVLVKNTGPVNHSIKVTYSDNMGWVAAGNQSRFLVPGDSSFITFAVAAPQGTPLGTITNITALVESLNDPTLVQTRNSSSHVVLQRGDVNFSGEIDLSDLSVLISYLLGVGPQPQPLIEAGNFDCAAGVDISDLSYLITYLVAGGGTSPCNPY